MNKIVKRLVAVTMALFMIPGAMPSIAMAAPVTGTSNETVETSSVTVETSTTAQIGSASSASAVTLDGEYTTAEVKADLRSIILLGKDKVVNVSKYGVSASDMDALVAEVLEENYVDGLIKVTCAVSKGMATYLVIERSEALVTAVDEMEAVTENAKASDEAESDAGASVAAASAYSISAYAAEDETEGDGQEGTETTAGLTDEQKKQLTSLYALYLQTHEKYPQYLGVMDPYFYTKNTDTSPLGGMLVVAGIPQAAIDAGMVSYDDLFGCIMTFYLGNMATVNFYGDKLIAAKEEAFEFVVKSGAKTYVDKLMVLMDWLSNRANFNMPYIMNQSQKDDEGNFITMMKAPSGNEPVNEYFASGDLEAYCKGVLTPIFEQGAMEDGREEGKKVGYAAYIKEHYPDAYDAVKKEMYQTVYNQVYEQAHSQMVEQGVSEDQAQEQAKHVATVEAEYAVAKKVAQTLDSQAPATLNVIITDANGNTLGKPVTLTKDGTKGKAVTFTAAEIETAAGSVDLPEGYELGTQNYTEVTVNGGDTGDVKFVATEKAASGEDNESESGSGEDAGSGEATDPESGSSEGTGSDSGSGEGTGSDSGSGEGTGSDSGSGEGTGSDSGSGEAAGSDSGSGSEESGDNTENASVAEAQSEAPVTVEDPAKEALTQNDEVAETGEGTAVLAEEETTEKTTEENTVDAAATAYAKDYAEGYAEQYAKNYAAQVAPMYAQGLAPQVVGSWNGNLVGALCLDRCVCKSYTYAYNYLIQWMNPDVYGKNGASTDLSNADNWKSPDDLFYESKEVPATGDDGEPLKGVEENPITISEKTFSTDAGYVVDSVRITYNKSTTMFGERPGDFSSDHYWSAVKVDGEWYYIDSCYADIYIECMMRSRVETDGYINNLYFMISDASARKMYDGYFDSETGLDTLYDSRNSSGLSDDTSYEHTWFSYAKSQVYSDGSGYYYMFDDTDALNELSKKGSSDSSAWEEEEKPTVYKLVYRPMALNNSDEKGSDSYAISSDKDVQVLIDVNNGTFYNGATMEKSDLLEDLYSRYQEYTENYPGIYVSMAYADGIAYMSIANTILAYDVKAHTLTRVLEYNKVYAERDMDNAFGGMAFKVMDKDGDNTLSVSNPPISAINIFGGMMTVSLATNYAFISGKKDSNDADDPGYAFQETNYNASYVNYSDYGINLGDYGGQLDGLIEQEDNDNDEFMWAANFVHNILLDKLTASEHNYEAVTVDPTCGIDGYSEYRCKDCGRIIEDEEHPREVNEGSALDHHYIHFTETYYTKEDGNFKKGETYVCAECLHSVNDSDDADETEWEALKNGEAASGHVYDYVSTEGQVKLSDDHSTITVSGGTLVCPTCDGNALDFLSNDETSGIKLDEEMSDVTVEMNLDKPLVLEATPYKTTGIEVTYIAKGEYNNLKFNVFETVKNEPGEHNHNEEIIPGKAATCTEDGLTEGKICSVCGTVLKKQEKIDPTGHKAVTISGKAATCTEAGLTDGEKCSVCGTVLKKQEEIKALGHSYGSWSTTKEATALSAGEQQRKCSRCGNVEKMTIAKLTATGALSETNVRLKVKQSATLSVTKMAKGDSVKSWKSSNTKIFKVSSKGKITGVKKGSATLTVTLASGKKLTTKVTVQTGTVRTTSISVNKKSVTLKNKATYQLVVKKAPFTSQESVTYSSSNKKVVTVSKSGKITAVKPGSATITVKSGSKKATVKVKVEKVKTTKLTASKTSITLKKGKSYSWKVTRAPKNSSEGITYTSANKKIATVSSSGKIIAKKKGTVVITAKSGSKSVKIKVTVK